MTVPNLGSLIVHAAARVATNGAVTNRQNVPSTNVRITAGIYDVNMSTAIDPTQRLIVATPGEVLRATAHIVGSDTDNRFRVSTTDMVGTLTDSIFTFMVLRYALPPV